MKEFQAFKDTLSNKALKAIYEKVNWKSKTKQLKVQKAFSLALATQNGYQSTRKL